MSAVAGVEPQPSITHLLSPKTDYPLWDSPSLFQMNFDEQMFQPFYTSNQISECSTSLFSHDSSYESSPLKSSFHDPASENDHYFVVTYLSWRSLKSDLKKSVIVSRGTTWAKLLDDYFTKGERVLVLFYIKSRKRFYGYGKMTSSTREFLDRKGFTFDLEVLTLYNCDSSEHNPFLPWLKYLKNGNEPLKQEEGTVICGIVDHIYHQKVVEKLFQSLQYSFQAWYGHLRVSGANNL